MSNFEAGRVKILDENTRQVIKEIDALTSDEAVLCDNGSITLKDKLANLSNSINKNYDQTNKTISNQETKIQNILKKNNQYDSNFTSINQQLSSISKQFDSVNTRFSNMKNSIVSNTNKITNLNDIIQGIGGRNLVRNSKITNTVTINNTESNTSAINNIKCCLTSDLKVGDYLSVSFIFGYKNLSIKKDQESNAKINIQGYGDVTLWNSGSFTGTVVPLNGLELNNANFKEYHAKSSFKLTEDHLKNNFWLLNLRTDYVGGSFYIKEIKIEKGNIPTSWTPAPEDVLEKGMTWNELEGV